MLEFCKLIWDGHDYIPYVWDEWMADSSGEMFVAEYGGKAVVLARFVPIVRTFVPFVAGAAQMKPGSFVFYNAVGAAGWVGLCVGAGLAFGNVPIIKNNFSM